MAEGNWKTGSGLIDEFEFTITSAEFKTNLKVNEGETPILHLLGTNSVTGDPEEDIRFTTSKNFEIAEKGARIVPLVQGANINTQSQYGKFMNAFLRCEGADVLVERRGMDPFVAATWVGLTLSLERVQKQATIRGQEVTMTEWIIHEITEAEKPKRKRGKAAAKEAEATEDAPPAPPAEAPAEPQPAEAPPADAAPAEPEPTPAPTPEPAPAAEVATEPASTEIPTKFAAAARGIAKANDVYENFVNTVYETVEGILNQPWEDDLVSKEFYEAARAQAA